MFLKTTFTTNWLQFALRLEIIINGYLDGATSLDQFKNKNVEYSIDVMQPSACLVIAPTMVCQGFNFNCTTEDQASDSMTTKT